MKIKFFYMIILYLWSNCCFALFCPNSFNVIAMGDSLAKVQATCGKESSATSANKKVEPKNQELTYYVKLGDANSTSVKMILAFIQGKLTSINVNGIGMANVSDCKSPIQLGMSIEQVKASCGTPDFVNAGNNDDKSTPSIKTDELTYSGAETKTLIFENERLIGVR